MTNIEAYLRTLPHGDGPKTAYEVIAVATCGGRFPLTLSDADLIDAYNRNTGESVTSIEELLGSDDADQTRE
jgi:hypothetical protein